MKTVKLNSLALLLLIPIFGMFSDKLPDSWLDGPFNHDTTSNFFDDKGVVPNTLYYNNDSDYYTIWDDETEKYITYDKRTNVAMNTVVFNAPEPNTGSGVVSGRARLVAGWDKVVRVDGERGGVIYAGTMAVPSSHLDEEGMRIQAEYGCAGCHDM